MGILSLRQYMTNPDGFINKFAVYIGMLNVMEGKSHAEKVVLHLLETKLNPCHHIVYMDNYYNSFALVKTLLEQKTRLHRNTKLNRRNTKRNGIS